MAKGTGNRWKNFRRTLLSRSSVEAEGWMSYEKKRGDFLTEWKEFLGTRLLSAIFFRI